MGRHSLLLYSLKVQPQSSSGKTTIEPYRCLSFDQHFKEINSVADREKCGRRKSPTDEETPTIVLTNIAKSPVNYERE